MKDNWWQIGAVIGAIGRADETLVPLVAGLRTANVDVLVVDNQGTCPFEKLWPEGPALRDGRTGSLHLMNAPMLDNIHKVWNMGMDWFGRQGYEWVAVLNDDIVLSEAAPALMATILEDDPKVTIAGFDYTVPSTDWSLRAEVAVRDVVGSYREGGIGGFAYMIRPWHGFRYDDRFGWWGGDDDLIWSILAAGQRAVVVDGCWVEHVGGGNLSGRHLPQVTASIGRDRELLLEKWGKAW